jgi:glycosyltransferase involved in cell wall biosynthesis
MRILYITNTTSGGGAPASLYNLVYGLHDRHEIAVVMPDSHGPLYSKLIELGVKCYSSCGYRLDIWPHVYRPSKLVRRFISLYKNRTSVPEHIEKIIQEFRPDIVHTNVGPLAVGYRAATRAGIPHVWHQREFQTLDFGMKFFPSEMVFRRYLMSENNYNIAITEAVFRHWRLRDGVDKVIYNAVPQHVSSERVYAHEPYFLYAARIEPSKDLMILLKAFHRYRNEGGKCELYVAGRPCGFYAFRCKAFAFMHGLSGAVHFLGQRNDVPELMAEASAFVMSSVCEGFGLTTAEAMLNRCVVIGRDTAGTKEQLDRGLRFVGREIGLRFTTSSQLTQCLHRVDEKSYKAAIEAMKEDAFKVVSENYTIERYASQVEEFYKSIIH